MSFASSLASGSTFSNGPDAPMSMFAHTILSNKYSHKLPSGRKETWEEVARRVARTVMTPYLPDLVPAVEKLIAQRKLMPGGRYLYAAGRKYPQVNNCFLFSVGDSREEWADLGSKCINSLMTGGGIGVVYSKLRAENSVIEGMGGRSTGPCALMQIINEAGRHIVQGGSRRSAIWAGLHWNHPDVFKFISMKEWRAEVVALKAQDYNFPAPLDGTNISIILDPAFFEAYGDPTHRDYNLACDVYWSGVRSMLRTGEPGFSVDIGENDGESLRNACCEVTSRDDSDMCNLASANLARIGSMDEMAEVVELGTAFLLCGTLYSKLPLPIMYKTREKNRRLGLGLMGVHEWLLQRSRRYGPDDELGKWLEVYAMSGSWANRYADRLSISRPVATRSIAPNGTISIIAETTSGIEPIFATAFKRRYLDGMTWKAQYVVDATAKRVIDQGADPELVEDSVTLAEDVERRMLFQSWVQEHVDHGISSTINLPEWGSTLNNEGTVTRFGNLLLKYLPGLRGITAYPNGSRGGQPLTRTDYTEAVRYMGREFVEGAADDPSMQETVVENGADQGCKSGVCGA